MKIFSRGEVIALLLVIIAASFAMGVLIAIYMIEDIGGCLP